jgi:hypothetical protein
MRNPQVWWEFWKFFRESWESRESSGNPGNLGNPVGILEIPWESWESRESRESGIRRFPLDCDASTDSVVVYSLNECISEQHENKTQMNYYHLSADGPSHTFKGKMQYSIYFLLWCFFYLFLEMRSFDKYYLNGDDL